MKLRTFGTIFFDEEIFNENALSLIVDVQSVSSSKERE